MQQGADKKIESDDDGIMDVDDPIPRRKRVRVEGTR